mgnify:CR=1 FL=1
MNMEQLKEFVCLETRKRELDSELKSIAARIDDLEQALVPQFLADGVASMKVDGRTVYIAQDIHASPANDRAEVIDALKRSELGQYVSENYNTQSVRAYVREVAEAYGLTQNAVIRWLDRVSRVVPIRDVAKGEFTGRPLAFFVTDHRDGFLVQLRELLTNE